MVGQLKRGSSYDGKLEVFETFVGDGDVGEPYWWDGKRLSGGGKMDWDSTGRVATFEDTPGFGPHPIGTRLLMGNAPKGSRLIMDAKKGIDNFNGYFDFKTYVAQYHEMDGRTPDQIIREINWSMRIDIKSAGNGGFWWSFSDQK